MHVILPEELYEIVWKDVEKKIKDIQYSRVIMKLADLLDGDFFNSYIKTGTLHLLSCHISYLYHYFAIV